MGHGTGFKSGKVSIGLKTWHGDESVATIENPDGYYDENGVSHPESYMFDSDLNTHFASPLNYADHVISFVFKSQIQFEWLTIGTKGYNDPLKWYENLCLVLDDDISDKLCTDSNNPRFDGKKSSITWIKSKQAQKVSLHFTTRGTNAPNGLVVLQISELFIRYRPLNMKIWQGDSSIASIDNQAGTYTPYYADDCGGTNCELKNIFDDDETTFWHSDSALGRFSNYKIIDYTNY